MVPKHTIINTSGFNHYAVNSKENDVSVRSSCPHQPEEETSGLWDEAGQVTLSTPKYISLPHTHTHTPPHLCMCYVVERGAAGNMGFPGMMGAVGIVYKAAGW